MLILPLLGLSLLLQAWIVVPNDVYADGPSITLKTELGYNGKIKASKWNPLKITLTSDTDISGDIVFQNNDNYMGAASFVQHVELPKDTPKEVVMGIPGMMYTKDNNQIRFYKDSVEDGKIIPFASDKSYIDGMAVNGAIIGVLSDDPDTMNFMNVLRSDGYDLNIVAMKASEISEDPMLLDGLDVLVINRFSSDTLSKSQISGISGWIKSGGTMVLAGGAGYPKTADAFADIAPVQYEGTFSVTSLPEIVALGGKPLNLEGNLTLSNARPLEESQVLYRAEDKPLFVSRQIEQGNVLYAAYDLAMTPIASWNGHPKVWANLLKEDLPLNNQNGMSMTPENQLNNLGYILNYFPSLKMPGFSGLVWLLLIYVVVVAPVLYWILRKVDKREWAWWIIPLIAILASGTVYTIGSADKTKELAHTLNVLELNGKGSSTTTSATAFFTPSSGDYTLEFPKNTHIRLQRDGGLGTSSANSSFIEVSDEKTKVDLLNMPQWTLAKMWAEQSDNRQVGQLKVSLSLDDQGTVEGEVINETTSDLTRVVLVLGAKVYELGDLSKDEKSNILKTTKGKNLNSMGGGIGDLLFPYSNNNIDDSNRERELLSNYAPYTSWYAQGSYIIAWSKDPILTYTHDGKPIASNQLNLWTQPVTIDLIHNGTVNIPFGYISSNMTQVNAAWWNQDPNGMMINMSQGVATFEYELPHFDSDAVYEELTLKATNVGQNVEFKIWNEKKLDWEVIVWKSGGYTINTDVEHYLMNGKILRLTVSAKGETSFTLPELRLKGKVNP